MASLCRGALVLLVASAFALSGSVEGSCSAQNCPKINPKEYTVHIVPHSHMDLGWLKTVEQYFFGTNAHITSVGVQYIYDSVLAELQKDPSKRFMFVETGFFELWWDHRDNATRESFTKLVMNGQIEFVSGGYVMNDEAAVHYMNTIDQMTYGLGILKEKFGKCGVSRIGWQIDPFGHSREFASLLAQMGFQGLYFGRIDYQDKDTREVNANMEFKWQASESLPDAHLTGVVLANNYSPPPGFCFDEFCDDEPVVEDPNAEEYNGPQRAKDLVKWLKDEATFYATNNFLVTMGNDFNYQNAHKWMSNLDALMRLINGKGFKINGLPVRLVYSTPSCYLEAIKGQKMTTKKDDFFPYASDPHAYWTGYFTSRPAFKYLDRMANNWYQAGKQLVAMAGHGANQLALLRRALAIGQHHDAITGTAKQHVNNDYTRMMAMGLDEVEKAAAKAVAGLAGSTPQQLIFCRGLNISQCDELDPLISSDGVYVVAYNPSSQTVRSYVRVPVALEDAKEFVVVDRDGANVVFDVIAISAGVLKLAERKSKATHEVVFPVEIGPLSFATVQIKQKTSKKVARATLELEVTKAMKIRRGSTTVHVEPGRGMVRLEVDGAQSDLTSGYFYYPSHAGNNSEFQFRASGAYIFRNNGPAKEIPLVSQTVVHGLTVTELRSQYGSQPNDIHQGWVHEILRVTDKGDVEFDWIVGPIPIKDGIGKEIIWRLQSSIDSKDEFLTDSNGREVLVRRRNFRPTWDVSIAEEVSGNYYPVNSMISIRQPNLQLAVLTDRSQGGTSLKSGQVELMMHRRCLHDDAFGVGEALNETGSDGRGLQIRGSYRVKLTAASVSSLRAEALQMALKPIVAFSSSALDPKQTLVDPTALPANVQLLSLEQTANNEYLVRLENIYELKLNPQVSSVDLKKLFGGRDISVRETLLAANIDRASSGSSRYGGPRDSVLANTKFTLHPMQIRTFVVTLQ